MKPESRPTLDQIADLLRARPDLRLQVVGHTDNVGRPDYNLDLSARRAANVLAALVETYAVDPGRLSSAGAGQTTPVAPNDSEDGRARNRRVKLKGVN